MLPPRPMRSRRVSLPPQRAAPVDARQRRGRPAAKAVTSSDRRDTRGICFNRRGDLLQPARMVVDGDNGDAERGGHGGGRHDFLLHKIFVGTSFLIAATGEDGAGAATAAMP